MNKEKAIILLDNGHGSNTPGKCSPDKSLLEYQWTREVVSMIDAKLKEEGYDSRIIVPEKTDISLANRVARCNKIYNDNGKNKKGKYVFLVSVHNNAAGNGGWRDARGFSVFVSENASTASKSLASTLYKEAEGFNLKGNRAVPKDKFWTANFYIIKKTNCPACLTENMFQDNKEDVKYLLSDKGKHEIMTVHVEGIKKFIESLK